MQKILITTSTFPRNEKDNLPRFVYDLALHLNKNFEVYVLAPYEKGSKKFEVWNGIKVYRYKYFFGYEGLAYGSGIVNNIKKKKWLILQIPFYFLGQFFALRKLVKKEEIKIVNAHWVTLQGVVASFYSLFNSKFTLFCSSHGTDLMGLNGGFFNFLKSFVLKRSKKLFAVSKPIAKAGEKYIEKDKIEIIPMGVDLDNFQNIEVDHNLKNQFKGEDGLLLFVGRLVKRKGVNFLISALNKIRKNLNLNLLIIGEGEEKQNLIKHAKSLGLEKNIFFLGFIGHQELPKYYAIADLFVGTSIDSGNKKMMDVEGLGLVYAEAMACNLLVLAANVGGVSDLVIDNKTGFLLDDVTDEKIEKKVIEIFKTSDQKRERIKNDAGKYVRDFFSWDNCVSRYSKNFERVK